MNTSMYTNRYAMLLSVRPDEQKSTVTSLAVSCLLIMRLELDIGLGFG